MCSSSNIVILERVTLRIIEIEIVRMLDLIFEEADRRVI